MRVKLSQIPFVRILIPFALGIVTNLIYPRHFLFYYTGIFSFILLLIWFWQEKNQNAEYKFRWVNGTLVTLFLFSAGYCVALLKAPSENTNYISNVGIDVKDSMLVTIVSIPQEKQKTYQLSLLW